MAQFLSDIDWYQFTVAGFLGWALRVLIVDWWRRTRG